MRYPAASLLALVATPLVAQGTTARPDACTGRWAGAIATPGAKLAFDVDFTRRADGACNGDISIPAQGARDVALTDVRVGGDSVRFTIPGVPGTPRFSGAVTVDGSAVRGSFAQGGATLAFEMTRGPNRVALAREALTGIGPWLDSAITAWKVVGLGVGVVVDGETVYLAGHGLRDREKKLPVTPQTLFAIGSSSKAFTTFAMGALVDQGKLAWDQPVRGWLPWFRMHDDFATMRITPRDLVTHRSGLPRHDALWYNNTTLSREELVRHIAHLPLSADLREKFQYNNLMFLTAGYLVGAINGSSWEDALRDLVLRPLGMTRTNFSVAESQRDADHSLPYRVKDDTVQRIPFRDISNVGPAGSINSSVEEMTKW
ncbi:MAG: beta-lactamase family protein, partial [Gemmatimonadaceae bacterium]|nr:beta-lactamase family protein [Gemmatimonadaceae bacterium]